MRTENVLWSLAMACAVFLLFAPFTPRTMWIYTGPTPYGNAATVRDAAGWDMVASLSGIVALLGLAVGVLCRPRVTGAVAGAVLALVAFAVTAYAAGQYCIDVRRGAAEIAEYATHPPQVRATLRRWQSSQWGWCWR